MITIKKLKSLKKETRFRKYITILQELENNLQNGKSYNSIYFKDLFKEIIVDDINPRIPVLLSEPLTLRVANSVRHIIMAKLGIEPSEWDFTAPLDKREKKKITSGINLYLDDIRSPFNLGSIFRSAECFATDMIYLSEDSTKPDHKRAIRTAMGAIDLVNYETKKLTELDLPIFALELGGTPIDQFHFPQKGIAIVGNEELGVSPTALKLADSSLGRVSIPLYGNKSSLNVSNATSILLQRWSEQNLKV